MWWTVAIVVGGVIVLAVFVWVVVTLLTNVSRGDDPDLDDDDATASRNSRKASWL